MRKQLLAAFIVCLFAGTSSAGFSLGRPAAVKKQVSKLDDKVHARQLAGAAANQAPTNVSVTAVSTTVAAGGLAVLSASATDPDGDTLHYSWTAASGTLSAAAGASVYWLAPSTPGVYSVNCVASDGKAAVPGNVGVAAVTPGTQKWKFTAADVVSVAPVLGSDGTVYVADAAKHLYARDSSGSPKWMVTTSDVLNYPPTVGPDGTVYAVDNSLNAYAFYPDGNLKWGPILLSVPVTVDASPVVGPDGQVYFYDSPNLALSVLDQATMVESSTFTDLSGILLAPVRGPDGTLYIVSNDGFDDILYAVPAAGVAASTQTIVTGITFPPAVGADGSVYWADVSNVNAASANGDTAKWAGSFSYTPAGADIGPVIGLDGDIYVLDSGSGVEHVHSSDGSFGGAYTSFTAPITMPATAGPDGAVYGVATADLYAATSNDYPLWGPFSAAPAASIIAAPAVSPDGTVYFGADDGSVYALYSTSKLP